MRRASDDSASRAVEVVYGADYFDRELHRSHWFKNNAAKRIRRWREVLRMLEPAATDRMLEIGCGAGLHTLKLARLAGDVVGIDRAFAGVARAQANADREGTRNAAFAACDAAALPFASAVFDKIAAIDFVEHVNDDVLDAVLREARRVLRADGRIALYTPCGTHYVEWLKERNLILRQIPGHVAVRGPEAYVRLLQRAGFAVRAYWFSPSDYPVLGMLDRALAAVPGAGRWFRFRICMVASSGPR